MLLSNCVVLMLFCALCCCLVLLCTASALYCCHVVCCCHVVLSCRVLLSCCVIIMLCVIVMLCCAQPCSVLLSCCVFIMLCFAQPLVAIKVLAALAQTYEAVPSPSLQAHYHNALALKARLLSGCGIPAEVAECYLEPPSSLKAPPPSSSPVSSGGRARRALVTATLHAKLSLAAIKLSNDEVCLC